MGFAKIYFTYQRKTTPIDAEFKTFGFGASVPGNIEPKQAYDGPKLARAKMLPVVVLQLCTVFPSECNFKLAFDNYFMSLLFLRHLKNRQIFSVGTIRSNRVERCPVLIEKVLANKVVAVMIIVQIMMVFLVLCCYDNKL